MKSSDGFAPHAALYTTVLPSEANRAGPTSPRSNVRRRGVGSIDWNSPQSRDRRARPPQRPQPPRRRHRARDRVCAVQGYLTARRTIGENLDARVADVAEALARSLSSGIDAAARRCAAVSPRAAASSLALSSDTRRQTLRRVLAWERALASQQLVQHAPERPDVRALVDRLALRLLRTHVCGGAEHHASATDAARSSSASGTDRRRAAVVERSWQARSRGP